METGSARYCRNRGYSLYVRSLGRREPQSGPRSCPQVSGSGVISRVQSVRHVLPFLYKKTESRHRQDGDYPSHLADGYQYLRNHPEIREVLLSGGDPLLLQDEELGAILSNLRAIPSIEVIRIGTRVPSVLPMRITKSLVAILKMHHPLYINTHFNHPWEITDESSLACTMLADAGIPLGCQTVLLKGVNDNAHTIKQLMLALLRIRVKPYYLFQADLTQGTNHFRTPTQTGIDIMRRLYGHISGLAIPTLALDAPGGKGKIPLTPQYILQKGQDLLFESYLGEVCTYPEAGESF